MNKKRQLVLTTFLVRTTYFGIGISYCLKYGKNLTILLMLLGMILGYLLLNILLSCNLTKFFKTKIGSLLILLLSFFIINNSLIAFGILGSNFYLASTPPLLIIISLSILILYGISKGLKTTLRLIDILIFISIPLLFFIFLSISHNISFANYLPLELNFSLDLLKSIIGSMVYSTTPLLLELSLLKEPDKPSIKKGYIIGNLTIILMVIYLIGIFGSNFALNYRYPEYILLKKINIFNQFLHLETFLALIWFNDLLTTSLLAGHIIAKTFKGKRLYLVSTIHILFNYYFFISNYQHILLIYHYTIYILLVPLILTIFLSKVSSQ